MEVGKSITANKPLVTNQKTVWKKNIIKTAKL